MGRLQGRPEVVLARRRGLFFSSTTNLFIEREEETQLPKRCSPEGRGKGKKMIAFQDEASPGTHFLSFSNIFFMDWFIFFLSNLASRARDGQARDNFQKDVRPKGGEKERK